MGLAQEALEELQAGAGRWALLRRRVPAIAAVTVPGTGPAGRGGGEKWKRRRRDFRLRRGRVWRGGVWRLSTERQLQHLLRLDVVENLDRAKVSARAFRQATTSIHFNNIVIMNSRLHNSPRFVLS